ncbi:MULTISPECIES: DUF418 domain-containing protein [unclassified Rathayibacter]|uniref:DUF418 domain-containing protein n=1 Tax=unclassified Rathayibacter TaxID=2609250 RepID=UPI000F4B1EBF|nr:MULTISPECIES: DUF418 domain-containing protein [unclassified Rathayibacter]ROP57528.1 uncharacterized protein EDF45_1064 [Rathayibacter sp. PhB186]ROS55913.1 uncharacterized protein EDF44_1064 [Rathayibacter sp. PhB185]
MTNTTVLPIAETARARIDSLDVVRGVAIIGTLGTNIWLFSHPWGLLGMLSEPVTPGTSPGAQTVQLVLMALAQGKFLALLSLTFGIGLAIQHASAVRRGRRWPGRYLWRATLLLFDGAVNYVLIAEFDVLMGYAVTGAVVAWLLLTRPRTQRRTVVVLGALHVLLISALVALVATQPGAAGQGPTGRSPYADASFLGLAVFRLQNTGVFRAEPLLIGFLSLAMFLLGAQLLRAGLFAEEGRLLRRRLMVLGAVAAPVDLALGLTGSAAGLLAERYLVAPLVALGLLALLAELGLRRGSDGWLARRAREVGRVALSAYLLQNLLGGALFYGWGLGLAVTVAPWRVPVTIGAFVLIASIVVLAAHLWLRRFAVGPVEWLWKRGEQLGSRPSR